MSRKRGWASPFWASPYSLGEPSNEVGASHQTRLGRAIKRGWGEPSNEVGRASTKPLGEPLVGRWASHSTFTANACLALLRCQLGTCPLGTSSACSAWCLLGTFSARSALHPLHGASSAPGCQLSYKCPLGTVPARHVPARHFLPAWHCACSAHLVTSARSAVPARHCYRCPLGTALPRSSPAPG